MNQLIIIFAVSLFLSPLMAISIDPQCQSNWQKICGQSGSIDQRKICAMKNQKKLSASCVQEISLSGENGRCFEEFQKKCHENEDRQDCLQRISSRLSPECRDAFSDKLNDSDQQMVQTCMPDINLHCKFDEDLALKDVNKAIKDYQQCIEKNTSKFSKNCQNNIKANEKLKK